MSKTQADEDAEMKEAIKKQLATGSPAVPVKTQAQRDEEMKSQIKSQLAAGSAPVPKRSQADQDAQMKEQIKKQLATGSTATPVKTQAQRDEEVKSQIKAQLAAGSAPTPQKTEGETDEELKRKIRAELDGSPTKEKDAAKEAPAPVGEGASEANTPTPRSSRTSRRQRRGNEEADAEIEAQARASLEASRPARAHSSKELEPGAPSARGLVVGDDVSTRQVTSVAVAPRPEVEGAEARLSATSTGAGARPSTSEKERPEPLGEEEGERVGAFSVATRAYGGMPAWIRQQAQENREAQMAQGNDESNLPPEMRGLTETPEQSDLPPEMRMAAPPPEASPEEDDPDVLSAEVTPAKIDDGKKGYRNLYIFSAVVIIAGACAGIGIAIGAAEDAPTKSPTRSPTASPTSSPTARTVPICPGYPEIDVDPLNMDEAMMERYADLLALAPDYWPDFTGPVKGSDDFCAPEHLALVWLAEDDADASRTDESVERRLMLSTVFFKTNGNAWKLNSTNWLSEMDECTWLGVLCDGNGAIIELDLDSQFPLVANQDDLLIDEYRFPTEITFLTDLRSLKMQSDILFGTIPGSLGNLVNLEILDFGFNQLTGSFPYSNTTSLDNLRVLSLDNNDALEVGLSEDIEQWPNLEMFSVVRAGAGSEWSLPTQIGTLSNLAVLNVASSNLIGVIPTEIGNLNNLEFVNLRLNPKVGGSLPSEIGNLANLKTLLIQRSRFSGSLPTEIGNLLMLERMVIVNNVLMTGVIPSEIGRCSMLETLVLALTSVRGSIPSEMSQLSNLAYVDVSDSFVESTIPADFFSLTSLIGFDATNTFMSGTVAVDTKNLTAITCLGVGGTAIQGVLTTENCEFPFENSNVLADCNMYHRETCACCSADSRPFPNASCKLFDPIFDVGKCGYAHDPTGRPVANTTRDARDFLIRQPVFEELKERDVLV